MFTFLKHQNTKCTSHNHYNRVCYKKGVGDVFNRDFAVKNFAVTEIQTRNLLTRFYFVAAAPSPQGEASSLSLTIRAFQEASSMGDLSAAATATVLVAGERTQNLYILNE